ncbi:NADAR family protein [Mesorhizobium sp. UC22_110]|uniref:NADAR family protein n=1 Tax=unclassified Mesorhizobium TaxID=325217 RepID=UPI00366C9654
MRIDQLQDVFRSGAALEFLFFWGHQPSSDGRLTVSCFSQWWPSPFEVAGIQYRTAEHWMMAEKARLFGDNETRLKIIGAFSPKQVKQFGREVRNFDGPCWDNNKERIVAEGSFEKFRQNPELTAFLLTTGEKVLVEASPVDRVWGIGLAADDDRAKNPMLWQGQNLLGFALMEAKDRLRN